MARRGSFYGGGEGSSKRRGSFYSSGDDAAPTSESESLLATAQEQGYEPKPKVGFLTRVGNVLSSLEVGDEVATGIRKYKETGDVGSAVGEAGKQFVSEAARGAGSALPMLDSITNPNDLAAERGGFEEVFDEVGWNPETGAGKLAKKAASIGADIVLDPMNLVGGSIVKGAGKVAGKGGKLAASALDKTDMGKKILEVGQSAKDVAGRTFKAGYEAEKVAPDVIPFAQKLKRAMNMGDTEVVGEVSKLTKKYGDDVMKNVPYEIDELNQGLKSYDEISDAAKESMSLVEGRTAWETTAGVRDSSIDNYFPREVIKEPMDSGFAGAGKMRTGLKGAEKGRQFDTQLAGEAAGFKYMEAPEALTKRLANSQRSEKTVDALQQLVAGEVKDINGNPMVKALDPAQGVLPNHVPVIIGKKGMSIATTVSDKAAYQMPAAAADYLVNVQKVFGNETATKDVLKIFDQVQNLWKGSVTSVFPAFHVRNAIGNIFNNMVGGIGIKESGAYLDAAKIQNGAGALPPQMAKLFPGVPTFEDLKRVLGELGVTSEGQFAVDVTDALKSARGGDNFISSIAKPQNLPGKAMDAGRKVGELVEGNARIAHFIAKVKKGESLEQAAASVNKFLFDYSDLTPFESQVLKRIFPFYTFSRKNIPLQLEQIFKQPEKYNAVFDAVEGLRSGDLTEEEKKYMPDYLREKFGIAVGRDSGGAPKILSGLGLPVEDLEKVGKPLKSVADMLSPGAKIPLEVGTGQSFYYGQEIKDTSAYNSTTKAIGEVPGLAEFLKAKPIKNAAGKTYYKVDPERMYAIKNMPFGRAFSTVEKATDERSNFLDKLLNTVSGAKIYSADIPKEKERVIMDMLKELGIVETFEKDFVRASTKEDLGMETRESKKKGSFYQ